MILYMIFAEKSSGSQHFCYLHLFLLLLFTLDRKRDRFPDLRKNIFLFPYYVSYYCPALFSQMIVYAASEGFSTHFSNLIFI